MAWTKWTEHNIRPATWHFSVPAFKHNNIIAKMLLLIANLYIALKPGVMLHTLTLKSCISYKSNWWEMFFRKPPREHTAPLFKKAKILSVILLYKLWICLIAHGIFCNNPPRDPTYPTWSSKISLPPPTVATSNRSTKHLKPGINCTNLRCHLRLPRSSTYWTHWYSFGCW